ncbi:PREDICTED: uncharacterized protein LOC106806175 [Priapulus caudatus]|uniref:Uncharacterized protein LOC106806175 n=1 Tax=Priapulus caudatus TaxID=37621 RepID=A0ABM1DUA8_PRICU|nr:PREDICTED: uncharacterized protein LOC106806175 [Priapulus caudatus]
MFEEGRRFFDGKSRNIAAARQHSPVRRSRLLLVESGQREARLCRAGPPTIRTVYFSEPGAARREGPCRQANVSPSWPLCVGDSIVVHVGDPHAADLRPGDFCICISRGCRGNARLAVKYRVGDVLQTIAVPEANYAHVFSRGWVAAAMADSADRGLAASLRQCLVVVERGTAMLDWSLVCCTRDACPTHPSGGAAAGRGAPTNLSGGRAAGGVPAEPEVKLRNKRGKRGRGARGRSWQARGAAAAADCQSSGAIDAGTSAIA